MEWTEIKTEKDIEILQRLHGNFEDSTLVEYRFESENYVDEKRTGYEYNKTNLYLLFQRLDDDPFSIEILYQKT